MKTVVITGSAKGFGFELAKEFRKNNFNVVLSDIIESDLDKAFNELNNIKIAGKVIKIKCDVTSFSDLENLCEKTVKEFNKIDIWISNAGVNQKMVPIWDVDNEKISNLIDINLKGSIYSSQVVLRQMKKQKFGSIYGIEGFGSDDAIMTGLSIYGTSKRALTYFYTALASEVEKEGLNINIGLIAPGIMITNFINHSNGTDKFELPEKTKKVYNILGDYPDVIAKFMVGKIINNNKNKVRFTWLTKSRAFYRFLTAGFNKRDFFKNRK